MKTQILTIEELAKILEESEITSTTDHAGMIANEINHPTIGAATVVSSLHGGALVITG